VATTIGSALLALSSLLMIDAWGEASAQMPFTRRNVARFWWKVLWTIVLALTPMVGTFYVLQSLFVTRKFRKILRRPGMAVGVHAYDIAKDIADTWVTVGVEHANTIPGQYRLNMQQANPDPDLVLNLAGTGDPRGNRQWPTVQGFHFFLLNYEGMVALLCSGSLNDVDYQQLRFLGRRTGLETVIVILQSMSYITAVVYRRIQHLNVTPIESIGFACSLLFLVYAVVKLFFGSRSKEGLLIYLTPAQELAIQNFCKAYPPPQWFADMDPDLWALILTRLVGLLVAGVATWLVYPVLATKNMVDMLGHIIFFGDLLLQFIFFIVHFKKGFRSVPLLLPGIIASVGLALAIYATIRHWHDQNFDIPTPSLRRYLPFVR